MTAGGSARPSLAALGVVATLALVVVLQLVAIERQSLTMDEPYHLLAGWQALAHGSNDLNWEHPPLVKLVAALPIVVGERFGRPVPWSAPARLDEALARSRELFADPERARWIRRCSRAAMLALFALPWLAVTFLLGREIAGAACGFALVAALGLSAMSLPYLALVQTDAAVALGFALTLLLALRHRRAPTVGNAAAVGAAAGLALAAKFSGLLLAPVVVVALLFPREARPAPPSFARRAAFLAVAFAAALAVVWLSYAVANRDHDARVGAASIRTYASNRGTLVVGERMRGLEPRLLALERRSPELAQLWTGFAGVRLQNEIGIYPTYAFGEVSSRGRWWFFPALLSIRLSLVLIGATGAALAVALRRRREALSPRSWLASDAALLAVTATIYLAVAMSSSYNLGSRHLLPILPLLLLPAALWASRHRGRLVAVVALLALEALLLAPRWMSATNSWWLGEANPTRFALGAGDTEYKQNFLELGREAERRGIRGLKVIFPGTETAEVAASIPGASVISPGPPGAAVEPGWYAVTVLAETTLPAILRAPASELHEAERFRALAREWMPLLGAIARGEDHGVVASSFRLYRVGADAAVGD
jgi:hypothetical protein